jgi:hypothetical protein
MCKETKVADEAVSRKDVVAREDVRFSTPEVAVRCGGEVGGRRSLGSGGVSVACTSGGER